MNVSHHGQSGIQPGKIAVVGLGHVGLPTAVGFSSLGWDVIGADEDPAKVEPIKSGRAPFFEPGLDELLQKNLASGKFCPTSKVEEAIRAASVIFICVGTPQREDGTADLTQVEAIARTIGRNLNGLWQVSGKNLGVLGLAFKPKTDDIREAPSLKIISTLLKEGAQLRIHDPCAVPAVQAALQPQAGKITFCASPYDAARGAEALLLLTEWDEYRLLDLGCLRGLMQDTVIIDGRNIFDPDEMRNAGFTYVGMGRKRVAPRMEKMAEVFQFRPAAMHRPNVEVDLNA